MLYSFFSRELIVDARKEMIQVFKENGYDYFVMDAIKVMKENSEKL